MKPKTHSESGYFWYLNEMKLLVGPWRSLELAEEACKLYTALMFTFEATEEDKRRYRALYKLRARTQVEYEEIQPITSFKGKHRWLSNFAPVTITYDGRLYPSTEHAYQAAKSMSPTVRQLISALKTPGQAKRFMRGAIKGVGDLLRPDWDEVKVSVMRHLQEQKYAQERYKSLLLATGGRELVEGNTWGDEFWGVCRGRGENNLGKIIMQVRSELCGDTITSADAPQPYA